MPANRPASRWRHARFLLPALSILALIAFLPRRGETQHRGAARNGSESADPLEAPGRTAAPLALGGPSTGSTGAATNAAVVGEPAAGARPSAGVPGASASSASAAAGSVTAPGTTPGAVATAPSTSAATPATPPATPAASGDESEVGEHGTLSPCHGPPECCVRDPARTTVPLPERVRVGLRVLSISDINEHDGLYSMDAYIMSRWPAGGLFPDLKIRNLADEVSVVDERIVSDGRMCYRARRFQNHFRTWYRLRRFPFDEQLLRVVLEDNLHSRDQVVFENEPWPVNYSADAYRALPDWAFSGYPTIRQRPANFVFTPGGRPAQLLILEIPIHRHWGFFFTRYFVPMWLIVALAYSLFWIRLDDVGASSGMGMTCVLAIIAFQLTQGDSLPRVPYMTLADKLYAACYVATTIALLVSIAASFYDYRGRTDRGERLLRVARVVFPVLFLAASGYAVYSGWSAHGAREQDQNRPLDPPRPPRGEVYWSPEDSRSVAAPSNATPAQGAPSAARTSLNDPPVTATTPRR